MPVITVRNLPDEVHRALRVRAALHGRSTEAEVRSILESAVKPASRMLIGDALAAIGRECGVDDQGLPVDREQQPAEPRRFE